jgi:xanthine dehydrogenase accessory factor
MNDWLPQAAQLYEERRPFVMATIVSTQGSSPRKTGARMLIVSRDEFYGSVGGGKGELLVIERALTLLSESETSHELFTVELTASEGQVCGGRVQLLLERIAPGSNLYIFGAGHIGQELCSVLNGTPFLIHLIDERKEWIQGRGHAAQVVCHGQNPISYAQGLKLAPHDAVVIMTHDHNLDYTLVSALAHQTSGFLGVIGSAAKKANFWRRLRDEEGVSEKRLNELVCPLGLVKAGDSPREIAISVAAQLLEWLYKKA